jgi:hypothetical protein
VESVASGETPRSLEVFAQVVDLLDSGDERVIDGLGVSSILVHIRTRQLLLKQQSL